MQSALVRLVVVQFVVYMILALVAFVAWVMAFSHSLSVLEVVFGRYLSGHLVRWTVRLPFWGVFMLISAVLAFGAAWFLWKLRREGAYLGVGSFLIAFVANIFFAQNILVHTLVGAVIGWVLLAPLVVVWKGLNQKA